MLRLIIPLLIIFVSAFSQTRIYLDEEYADWEGVTTSYTDPSGDQEYGQFDFKTMWISNDDQYLFIRIQTGDDIVATADNYMTLYIDTDNNANTGKSVNDIGAEVEYTFGPRSGRVYFNGGSSIDHRDIGLFVSPTIESKQFEIAISRSASINGQPLFGGDNIKIAFVNYVDFSLNEYTDIAPDNGGVDYQFKAGEYDRLPNYSIKKKDPGFLRVVAFNVEQDGILETNKTTEFNHIFDAIEPEILGLCEVYDGTSQQVADRMEFFLPSESGEQWYHKKEEAYDIVLVSRFQIKESFTINSGIGHDASGAFLLNLRPKFETDMLVIVSHPKCCNYEGDEDDKRQDQIDAIMSFISDAKNEGGEITIPFNAPIVVMGDMNFVGDDRQQRTLLTGDIANNGLYGDDFDPDWDGSNLEDAKPFVVNTPMTYTTNAGSYPSGRLDYCVYSGSVLDVANSYIFNTTTLPQDSLSVYGLDAGDTRVSDHLPVVVDFDLSPVTGIKKKDELPRGLKLMQNYPNPFNPTTTIKFALPTVGTTHELSLRVELVVYNALGQKIKTLINRSMHPGTYEIEFDGTNFPSGIYYYRLTSGNLSLTKKMLILK